MNVLSGLRGRLLAAFVLVAVPPLLLMALFVNVLISRRFERAAEQRLEEALRTARAEIEKRRRRAEEQVALVAAVDLPAAPSGEEEERTLASAIAPRRDLAALEILDSGGRVISSHHWPAGFGLPEGDGVFPGDEALRWEKVAQGYGAMESLALMPARPGRFRGAPVIVRGGPFLDEGFLADLSALMGVEVAFRDLLRRRWVAPATSPLGSWEEAAFSQTPARGDVVLGGASYRWAAGSVNPALWLVVATPRTAVQTVTRYVRRIGLGIAGAVVVSALLAALLLSGRIARPVHELAQGARRVAAGDLTGEVPAYTADEIGDLARAFNAMTAELRASRDRLLQAERVAAWREMARRLAHELKNPLFPIQLSIETLRRALEQPSEGGPGASGRGFRALFLESSETIIDELRSLRKIIDEFSEFARMPQPQLTPTAINAVVEQAVDLYRARAGEVAIELSLSLGLPPVHADRDLLGRALANLISNALEAMPQGGALRIRTAEAPGAVTVAVEDTGPGLTEEQRTRLFTPYYTTKKGGTGLGLAIVQGIVSDHGGRVAVRSEPGEGTTFILVLPSAGR